MIKAVLDTNVINIAIQRSFGSGDPGRLLYDKYIEGGKLSVWCDPGHSLLDEWMDTCGRELVQRIIIRWQDMGALKSVDSLGVFPAGISRRLSELGFRDPIDRVLLKIAIAVGECVVTSEDSDFWNPMPASESDESTPVHDICLGDLDIDVVTLDGLLAMLEPA